LHSVESVLVIDKPRVFVCSDKVDIGRNKHTTPAISLLTTCGELAVHKFATSNALVWPKGEMLIFYLDGYL
jgi:hypothetical protein